MPSQEAIEAFFKYATEAMKTPLGIFSMLIIAGGFLAYIWFSKERVEIRIGIFAAIFLGIVSYGFAISRVPKTAEKPDPVITKATYSGRVVNKKTLETIHGAKITLSIAGAAPGYSDSNGNYTIEAPPANESITVRAEADSYDVYEQGLSPGPDHHFEDIRMTPKPSSVAPTIKTTKSISALTGQVIDAETGAKIVGAMVTLTLDDGEPRNRTTDSGGVYSFDRVPSAATGLLQVRSSAYKPFERHLSAQTRSELKTIRMLK